MCHEQKPLKKYVSVAHLPARVKARQTVNYHPHTDTKTIIAWALAFSLKVVVSLIRYPLVCLSGGARTRFKGFLMPLVE